MDKTYLESMYLQFKAANGLADGERMQELLKRVYNHAYSQAIDDFLKAMLEAPVGTYDSYKNVEKYIRDNF